MFFRLVRIAMFSVLVGSPVAVASPAGIVGIDLRRIPPKFRASLIEAGVSGGVHLKLVFPKCPAHGILNANDIITKIDDVPVSNHIRMAQIIGAKPPGTVVSFEFYRGENRYLEWTRHQADIVVGIRTLRGCVIVPPITDTAPSTTQANTYASPYKADGQLAQWVTGAGTGNTTVAGAIGQDLAGRAASELTKRATNQLASQIPFGSLLSGTAQRASADAARSAVANATQPSMDADVFFATPCELANHLHSGFSTRPDYPRALQAVFQRYGDVQTQFQVCVTANQAHVKITAPTPQATTPDGQDFVGQIERLKKLHDEGVLSDDEFAAAKARVLGL